MKDMQMDKSELGCLRAIVLFNPGDGATPAPCARPQRAGVLRSSRSAETRDSGPGHRPQGGQRVRSARCPCQRRLQKS